ncbi:TonB-dependent receptor [Paraglaciecola chathamensis]|uniref:TonB-dependent receptor n=1 Tax=Paraglaciecola agarilytica NO2 TaxID=1125747 RepID=A0ABQ0IEB1_9ALTE|nr:TonB-dependent receptor [Paraglaciecola agarilytica]GAC07577.1 TonB-dependent receptor [Paraglaciecola agarilytica NO2]
MLVNNNFNKKTIAIAVTAALFNFASPTIAQEGDSANSEVEQIQVVGIRGALISAGSIKRDSSGVVDAITAEDIGKFPDTNLAESLQRIPGVSIDRSNNEGNQVTVRGFGPNFNMVTLNGRQMPRSSSLTSDGIPRSFNFRELSSDTVSAIQVTKTARADVDSGGMGATINIETARPFDYDGFKAFGSVKGIIDRSVETGDNITPEVSGVISNTFLDGKVGVLMALSHSERHSHTDRVGTEGWERNRGQNIDTGNIDNGTGSWWAPWTVDLDLMDTERTRQNAQFVLQFEPTDDLIATFDYTIQQFEQKSIMNRQGLWFDNPTGTPDANGTLVNPIEVTDELNFWAWQFLEQTEGDSFGINLEWQATDSLNFTLDFHDSTSKSNPDGINSEHRANLANGAFQLNDEGVMQGVATKLVDFTADFSGDIPSVSVDDSALPGGAYSVSNIIPDLFHTFGYEIDNTIQQARLAGNWVNNSNGPLIEVNFGIQNTEYQVDTRQFGTFAFVTTLNIDELGLEFEEVGDALSEFGDASSIYPFVPRYSANRFIELAQQQDLFFQVPPSLDGVTEETLAAFVSADFEFEIGEMPAYVNVGVRYEQTDVTAYSVLEKVQNLQYNHVEGIQQVFDGNPVAQTLKGDYNNILPNIDLKLDITDDLVGRFSYGKSITRSELDQLFPSTRIGQIRPGDQATASQGNPNLLPYESDNYDLSAEYYYGEASYASVGYFRKNVDNFIGEVTILSTLDDTNGNPLTDPSVNADPNLCPSDLVPDPNCYNRPDQPIINFELTIPTNLATAKVDGWEFNIQHVFGDSGFGAIANYTVVNSDAEYDVRKIDGNRALTGLSDSANLVGFYEKDDIMVRLAYNWRDKFLLQGGNEPTFTEEYGQLDANASYQINENFTVFIEGLNLTNATIRRHGRYAEQLIDAEQYGSRYNVGVRFKF